MLFGAVGQCLTMVLLAVLGSVKGSGAQVVSAVLLFVFNSFFAVGWLGMTWLYVRLHAYARILQSWMIDVDSLPRLWDCESVRQPTH